MKVRDGMLRMDWERRIARVRWSGMIGSAGLALLLTACAGPGARTTDGRAAEPGSALVGLMTEGELDRVADATATALRSSKLASSAGAPIKIAPPDWVNAANVPVDQPAVFLDAFTGMVNDRSGANVQFARRPWVRPDAPPGEVLASSDLRSRVSVLPDRKRSDRTLILRTEVLDAGGRATFSHDEPFAVVPSAVAKARKVEEKREVQLEEAKEEYREPISESGEVRFARGSLSSKVRISRSPPTKLPDGRLRFKARFRPNASKLRIAVQAFFYDAEGRPVEVSRRVLLQLRAGRGSDVEITSQLPADRCVIMVDRY
jgi:hypothetical protein